MGLLRRALIRTTGPILLRRRDRVGAMLARFSATEADSAWQFLRAVDALPTPEQKAQMFETCIEEMHHAALFEELARKRKTLLRPSVALERTVVMPTYHDLPAFLAYAHVSEDDINRDFSALARASSDPEVRAVFESIQADEALHEEGAEHLLDRIIPSSRAKRRTILAAHLRRTKANAAVAVGRLGDAIATTILCVVYFAFGAMVAGPCRKRMRAVSPPAAAERKAARDASTSNSAERPA